MTNKPRSPTVSRFFRTLLGLLLLLGLGSSLTWGFIAGRGEATAEAQREQPVKAAIQVSQDDAGATVITVGSDLQKRTGIEIADLKAAPYQQQIQAYGSVLDLQSFTDLSNTIANAKAQLEIAKAKLFASQAAFNRAQVLNENRQVISTAQLQAAEATYRTDEASAQGAQVQMQNAAASASQSWGPVLGKSLAESIGLAKELVEHRKVLVQVTVPIGVSLPKPPEAASIETTTGQRVNINFVSPATRTDPKVQGLSFFYTADAASEALPGMNVIAFLPAGQPAPGLAIPASAVVWLQGKAWVYQQTAADRFTRHEIPTTQPQAGGAYVVAVSGTASRPEADAPASDDADASAQGFPTNEPLVVKGAQMLLSQEFGAQIQVGKD